MNCGQRSHRFQVTGETIRDHRVPQLLVALGLKAYIISQKSLLSPGQMVTHTTHYFFVQFFYNSFIINIFLTYSLIFPIDKKTQYADISKC